MSETSAPLRTVEFIDKRPSLEWVLAPADSDGTALKNKNPLQREWAGEIAADTDPRTALAQPRGESPGYLFSRWRSTANEGSKTPEQPAAPSPRGASHTGNIFHTSRP